MVTRETFRENPIDAAMISARKWIEMAKRLKVDLQLSAALPIPDAYLPLETMLDPVAAHLAVRTRSSIDGEDLSNANAQTLINACDGKVQICDLGFFENLLHPDETIRGRIHAHLMRCARAAKKLAPAGCGGVTGFIGANPNLDMDQNVDLFERVVIPLLVQFKEMDLTYWVEQCPMPGWNTQDNFVNNIAYCAGMWIKLIRIAEEHGVDGVLRITYDESHDILMGNTHHGSFAAMKAAGLGHVVSRFHGKNQYRDLAKTAIWTTRGQMIDLGCRENGKPDPDPAKQGGAWGVMTCDHGMIGVGHYNPLAMLTGNEADWFDHQYAARDVLGLNPEETTFILEHEWGPGRVQDPEQIEEMLALSVAYIRGIDQAADALYRSKAWCQSRGLPLPGTPNPAYKIRGLTEATMGITT
jgi:sugar phosphate isomerase/epimerase